MMVEEVGGLLDATFSWLQRPTTAGPGETANFYYYNMPDKPDEAYAIYQYPGQAPSRNLRTGPKIMKPRMQILARGTKIKTIMDNMELLKNFLSLQQEVVIGGVLYHDIYPLAEPGELGPDTGNRERVSCNFQILKEPS